MESRRMRACVLRADSLPELQIGITAFRASDPVSAGPHVVHCVRNLRAPVPFSVLDTRERRPARPARLG